jgi:hypothetical protein
MVVAAGLVVGGALTFMGSKLPPLQTAQRSLLKPLPLLPLEISPWTGRFYSLLDPSYAKNNIPIIASVSEHQPTTWSSFYFDLQLLVFMFPGELNL